ncbi:hypothetical protein BDZ89DRAFT_1157099 [Hymenopellis radicata]|nr:hypothetical protein BDZ89DRAFT_1157099 [Hymenopellis radicata]
MQHSARVTVSRPPSRSSHSSCRSGTDQNVSPDTGSSRAQSPTSSDAAPSFEHMRTSTPAVPLRQSEASSIITFLTEQIARFEKQDEVLRNEHKEREARLADREAELWKEFKVQEAGRETKLAEREAALKTEAKDREARLDEREAVLKTEAKDREARLDEREAALKTEYRERQARLDKQADEVLRLHTSFEGQRAAYKS